MTTTVQRGLATRSRNRNTPELVNTPFDELKDFDKTAKVTNLRTAIQHLTAAEYITPETSYSMTIIANVLLTFTLQYSSKLDTKATDTLRAAAFILVDGDTSETASTVASKVLDQTDAARAALDNVIANLNTAANSFTDRASCPSTTTIGFLRCGAEA